MQAGHWEAEVEGFTGECCEEGVQISFKNAAEEKSLEVNFTAKMMPFMLARSPFHLPLLPEEGGGEGEEDLEGEAARVTQCIKREKVILNQC